MSQGLLCFSLACFQGVFIVQAMLHFSLDVSLVISVSKPSLVSLCILCCLFFCQLILYLHFICFKVIKFVSVSVISPQMSLKTSFCFRKYLFCVVTCFICTNLHYSHLEIPVTNILVQNLVVFNALIALSAEKTCLCSLILTCVFLKIDGPTNGLMHLIKCSCMIGFMQLCVFF